MIMYNGAQVTLVGNLGGDPDLRYTPTGRPVASISVAVVIRQRRDNEWKDANTTWYRVNIWGRLAENVAESLIRGARVIVVGTLSARSYEDRDGNQRTAWEVTADSVAADLTFASVKINRTVREHGPAPADPRTGEAATERDRPAGDPVDHETSRTYAGETEPEPTGLDEFAGKPEQAKTTKASK